MDQERRKTARYEVENSLSIQTEGVYQVVDISEGGFRFKCPPHTAIPETWQTDIISSIIPLEQFAVRKVWVSIYENGHSDVPALMEVGAKFDFLKEEQEINLKQFMKNLSPTKKLKDK